jgi:mannose-6-phosphate isomerase-like protein (cupin superfamily)
MVYTETYYENVDPPTSGLYMLREALECENLGITVLDADADWTGLEHDHADENQEEVYLLITGSGLLTVNGEPVLLEPGVAVRVSPEATRQLEFHEPSHMVIAGAP